MSAVEAQKVADVPAAGHVEPALAPIEPVHIDKYVDPVVDAPKVEENTTETETVAPAVENKDEKLDAKVVEPIYSGVLGYKAPGLKNAFRFAKKHFWFGEEPVPASNLTEYLRGEKPEVSHPVAAWSSHTGKGLLYFVKHAEQKEHPAGVLNLAYATDLVKDGADAFALKISGSKHAFEAQTAAERDSWFIAFEKAISDAKESKEDIESSESYKDHKEKISKPATLAAATASTSTPTPKKSVDATPALASTSAPAGEEAIVAAPARAGSSSSSSSDEEKKAKKSKSKSRSVSRGKRASIFGGLLGKKDKAEDKAEQKKVEHKTDGEVVKEESENKTDETPIALPVTETSTTTPATTTIVPVIVQDIPEASEELKTEVAPIIPAAPIEESKLDEPLVKASEAEKPKPTKRASIFGSVFNKLSSPTSEKKEADVFPAPPAKAVEPTIETSKPVEEAQVTLPATSEVISEPAAPKIDDVTPDSKPAVSTPSKEKEHFSFGRFFSGSKDRAKSPAATEKAPIHEPAKVDAVAPRIEDPPAPVTSEPVVAAPALDSKPESVVADDKKDEVKKEKRTSIFATLGRSLSKAGKGKDTKEKKDTVVPTTVPETAEENKTSTVVDDKVETPVVAAPAEKSIGDVVPEAITVGEAPKSNPAVVPSA